MLNRIHRLSGRATPFKPIHWVQSSNTIEPKAVIELVILDSLIRAYNTCRDRRGNLRKISELGWSRGNKFALT